MSRDEGFVIADTDTGLFSDRKVLALARLLRDSTRTGAALALWDAVRLASWREGERLTVDECAPGWWLDPYEDLADALVKVGLLDDERRLPEHAWEGWFTPAYERRQRYRDLGSKGGHAKAANERSGVRSSVRHSPSVPTGPTGPTLPRAPARERARGRSEGMEAVRDVLRHVPRAG